VKNLPLDSVNSYSQQSIRLSRDNCQVRKQKLIDACTVRPQLKQLLKVTLTNKLKPRDLIRLFIVSLEGELAHPWNGNHSILVVDSQDCPDLDLPVMRVTSLSIKPKIRHIEIIVRKCWTWLVVMKESQSRLICRIA
jgi:hypothetical protein